MFTKEKIVQFKDIGKIVLKNHTKAKNIKISVASGKNVLVTVPERVSFKQAIRFVNSKKEWIKKSLVKIREHREKGMIFTNNKPICTRFHKMKLIPIDENIIHFSIKPGIVEFRYPNNIDIADNIIQDGIKYTLRETYRIEAKQILPAKLQALAVKFGFSYNRLFIKAQKSVWGSCSSNRNINLNLQLMRLPDELIDYVLLHELTHLKVHKHGPEFWNYLCSMMPDARDRNNKLKQYNLHDLFPNN